MKQVLAYLRVSTASQIEGDGFPRQQEACKRFAEVKGWSVVRYLKEQQSGSDHLSERPVMQELLALVGGGGAGYDTILVERVDRIARDVVIAELFFRECKEKGVSVYAADSGEELVNAEGDPTRILIRQILGALSQWDKAQICKKLQAGRRRKKRETGKPCGGPLPYGQDEDEGEASALADWILDTIVQYRRYERSYRWIARWFHFHHIPTPRAAAKWSPGMIHNLYHKNSERVISPDYEIYHRSFIKKFERPIGGARVASVECGGHQVVKSARQFGECNSESRTGLALDSKQ